MKTRLENPDSRKTRQRGFTLMEMVLVLGIVALLVGSGIYYLVGVLDVGKESRVKADINTMTAALRTYETSNMFLPTTQQGILALYEKPNSRPQPKNWRRLLKKMLIDPWGNNYHYARPGKRDSGGFDLFSAGPDGIPGNDDDIGNWDL